MNSDDQSARTIERAWTWEGHKTFISRLLSAFTSCSERTEEEDFGAAVQLSI